MASCGTVEVIPQFDPGKVQVVSCNVGSGNATPGQAVQASASVANNNTDAASEVTVRFSSGGERVESTQTVAPQSTTTFTGSFTYQEPGEYTIDVRIQSAGRA
jgi:subtilase family serine protease